MKITSNFILLVSLFVFFSITGCGSTSNTPASQQVGRDIIQKYNFHLEGQASTASLILPQQFNEANWGVIESVCEQGGYSLNSYAGQSISEIRYNIVETWGSEPLYLWVLAKDQTSVCSYLSVRENSNVTPGVFAVNNSEIYSATSSHQFDTLQYTLISRGIVKQGEVVPITLTVKNNGNGLFETFTGSPEANVQVFKDNTEIWNPYFGLAFPAVVHPLSIAVGETKKYEFGWSQKDNAGNQVSAGNYTIKASFIGNTEQVVISIQ